MVAAQPQNPVFRDTLGWACFQADDPQTALEHLREAIRLAPDQATSHYRLGKVLAATGRLEEARGCFQAALRHGLGGAARADAEKWQ